MELSSLLQIPGRELARQNGQIRRDDPDDADGTGSDLRAAHKLLHRRQDRP